MDNTPNVVVPTNTIPSVTVIGCGGCGINMVRRSLGNLRACAKYRYIDTSYSNVQSGEEVIVVDGEGSGGVRAELAAKILKKVAAISSEDIHLADINIVVFSMSGGSGSVLAPLLIREIKRRGKLVVAMAVASSESLGHTDNLHKTLQSLENDATKFDICLPISIFDNAVSGKTAVDMLMPTKLNELVDILTLPTIELDKTDRLHWINVQKTIGAPAGLKILWTGGEHNDVELSVLDPDFICDSVISIRSATRSKPSVPKARTLYEGMFVDPEVPEMLGGIGSPPGVFGKLLKHIEDVRVQYQAQSLKKSTVVDLSDAEIDPESGLIL